MTDFDLFINNHFLQRNLVGLVIVVIIANLIIGGILLPYQQLQRAQAAWSNTPSQILQIILEVVANAWKIIKAEYANIQAALSAAALAWQNANTILKEALKVAWNILRKKLLNMIVNDIIAWVNGDQAKPKFVTDWQGFLKKAADKAAGQLLDKMGMGFLCTKFSFQLRLALTSPKPFDETATCTLSGAIANIDNFMADFSKGGWGGWIAISESQNNYMGAYFLALNEKYDVMSKADAAAKNEGISSTGFLGDKVCTTRRCSNASGSLVGSDQGYTGASLGWTDQQLQQNLPAGATRCECLAQTTRTPGRVAGDALQQAAGIDIENLIQSKEFAEYAAAIIDAVINRVIKEGVALMKSSPEGTSAGQTGPGIDTPPVITIDDSAYTRALSNTAVMTTMIPQFGLFAENIGKVITEYQTNLNILNNIRTSQNNSLNILTNLLQNRCALPAGVLVSSIAGTSQTSGSCTIVGTIITGCPCTTTTIENVNLSATGIGEAILRKTTTQDYVSDPILGSCTADATSISYLSLSTTVAIENKITTTNTALTDLQNQISKITTATADASAYKTAADTYIDLYEDWAKGNLAAATSTAEVIMNAAETKAIASIQAAIPSSSVKFKDLLDELMRKSATLGEKIGELMTERGPLPDCTYAESGLYKDLCDAQAKEASYQTALNNCLSPP